MKEIAELALELDKLKSVYRKSYISDTSRRENSAEHSWHLALTIMGFAKFLPSTVDINRIIRMALCHDICEIGAGDVSAYFVTDAQYEKELQYMSEFESRFPGIGTEAKALWQEYEDGETEESRWLKVFDKLLPFILNIQSRGLTWQEQGVTKSMILNHNEFIAELAPEIHAWMLTQIDLAVEKGWLKDTLVK
jgi:putative hydrolase of HD superfamily